jgi:hypothetical protein
MDTMPPVFKRRTKMHGFQSCKSAKMNARPIFAHVGGSWVLISNRPPGGQNLQPLRSRRLPSEANSQHLATFAGFSHEARCGQEEVWEVWARRGLSKKRCGQEEVWARSGVGKKWCGQEEVWARRGVGKKRCGQEEVWARRGVSKKRCEQEEV